MGGARGSVLFAMAAVRSLGLLRCSSKRGRNPICRRWRRGHRRNLFRVRLPGAISDFVGQWDLKRVIHDTRAGQVVQADGQAHLSQCDNGLIYDEAVTLRLPGQEAMKGTRRYLWRDAGDAVSVHFDDGRFFHNLKLGRPMAEDHHDCPPDSYDAVYDFTGWPRWSVRWTVSGPRKSYQMDTEYRLR